MKGSCASELRLGSVGPASVEVLLASLLRFSTMDDLFLLCLEVRLSSSGFMSGGSFVILWNTIARHSEMHSDIRNNAPLTMPKRKMAWMILSSATGSSKTDFHCLPTCLVYCVLLISAVKTKNDTMLVSAIVAKSI